MAETMDEDRPPDMMSRSKRCFWIAAMVSTKAMRRERAGRQIPLDSALHASVKISATHLTVSGGDQGNNPGLDDWVFLGLQAVVPVKLHCLHT